MKVLSAVVLVRMSVPPTLPRLAVGVPLLVMYIEVVVRVPPYLQKRLLHERGKVPEVVTQNEGVRRVLGFEFGTLEPLRFAQARVHGSQNPKIDRGRI